MNNRADIPNSFPLLDTRHDNARTLMTVLIIMAFLASLALVFALSAKRLQTNWQHELDRTATLQVMIENSDVRDLKITSVMTILETEFPDASLKAIEHEEAKALLRPWLGSIDLPEDLPIPALIAIEFDKMDKLDDTHILDMQSLKSKLAAEGLIVDIDDHSRWSSQISRTGQGLWLSALAMLSLIFFACAAVSAFATQAALSAQRDIIRVLLQVGASDSFVTKLFIIQAGKRGLISGVIGVTIGAVICFVLRLRRNSETALLPDLTLNLTDVFWLLLLALTIGILCALAAGLTSFRLLRQEHRRA